MKQKKDKHDLTTLFCNTFNCFHLLCPRRDRPPDGVHYIEGEPGVLLQLLVVGLGDLCGGGVVVAAVDQVQHIQHTELYNLHTTAVHNS